MNIPKAEQLAAAMRVAKKRRDRIIIDRLERIFATDDGLNGGDFVQAVALALKGDISWLDELIPRCEEEGCHEDEDPKNDPANALPATECGGWERP